MQLLTRLQKSLSEGRLPERVYVVFLQLYESYYSSIKLAGMNMDDYDHLFHFLLDEIERQVPSPFSFAPYHRTIPAFYDFGLEFGRPLIDQAKTKVMHLENVQKMHEQIQRGENVVLLANHQTEIDPQLISLILEKDYPEFGREMIFVAGDRVITDPLAVPFSMGRNLLCIYSKRHINNPPEKKSEKQMHNQRTMKLMRDLFAEGSKCIYVAPSGGRDRADQSGNVVLSPFDPQSVEMFRLMAEASGKPTHFYPLALGTYDILPPPESVEIELGERRHIRREGIKMSFGKEIDMDNFPGSEIEDRHAVRSARAMHIWNLVKTSYQEMMQ